MESDSPRSEEAISESRSRGRFKLARRFSWLMRSGLLSITLPLIAGIFTWYLNEGSKRESEEYLRREQSYKALVNSLSGFYINPASLQERQAFLEQVRTCWLYCSDDVIDKANAFLDKVKTGANSREEDRNTAASELVLEIRKDLISRKPLRKTKLTAQDYRHFVINPVP